MEGVSGGERHSQDTLHSGRASSLVWQKTSIHYYSKRHLEVMVELMKEKHRAKEWGAADFLEEPFGRGLSGMCKFTQGQGLSRGSFRVDGVEVLWRYSSGKRNR